MVSGKFIVWHAGGTSGVDDFQLGKYHLRRGRAQVNADAAQETRGHAAAPGVSGTTASLIKRLFGSASISGAT